MRSDDGLARKFLPAGGRQSIETVLMGRPRFTAREHSGSGVRRVRVLRDRPGRIPPALGAGRDRRRSSMSRVLAVQGGARGTRAHGHGEPLHYDAVRTSPSCRTTSTWGSRRPTSPCPSAGPGHPPWPGRASPAHLAPGLHAAAERRGPLDPAARCPALEAGVKLMAACDAFVAARGARSSMQDAGRRQNDSPTHAHEPACAACPACRPCPREPDPPW